MAGMPSSAISIPIPVLLVGIAIFSLLLRSLLQYRKLRHIPGPFAAKFTNWWLARKFWNKEDFQGIALDLDKKYGSVVRYGPDRVMFSDLSAVPVVFNTKNAFRKSESYEVAHQAINGQVIASWASIRDEARVSALKRQIISAFTTTAILDYESHVDHNINFLIKSLADSGPEVNIAQWTIFYSFDTICNIAFSDDQGFMQKQSDLDDTLDGVRQRFQHWHNWQSLPKVEKLLFKNRLASRVTKTPILAKLASERLKTRFEKGGLGTHSDLLDRYLQASAREPALFDSSTITGLVLSTIHAGAETTASTINCLLYQLLRHQRVFAKLKTEIDTANLSSPPSWTSANKLRYMEACFKESFRMTPFFIDPMERDVPPEGVEISGVYIPGGTAVTLNTHAMNRDPNIWGEDVDIYRPERWLEADEVALAKMERATLYFGGGRRICIGQHIAWIEMKKLLPELINRFNIELVHPERPLQGPKGTMVVFVDELMVRLTPR